MTFPYIEVFGTDREPLGPIVVLLGKKWHQDESLQIPGEQAVTIGEHLVIKDGDFDIHTKITAHLKVSLRHYLGPLGIKMDGFRDDQNNSIITKELSTDALDPARIARGEMAGWNEIPDKEDLAVMAVFGMFVVSALPETIEEMNNMMPPSTT